MCGRQHAQQRHNLQQPGSQKQCRKMVRETSETQQNSKLRARLRFNGQQTREVAPNIWEA